MSEQFQVGDVVTAIYKTGKYIGKVTAIKPAHYLVQVKSVLKHPRQGDLHNPKSTDVPLFHERRALAFEEQANIPMSHVKKYEGEIPLYADSLKEALLADITALEEEGSEWANMALQNLRSLEKDYFKH